MERTFVMMKPDGVQRGLIGKIIQRFEDRGMKIVAMKLIQVTKQIAERQYEEHVGKPFYNLLMEYILSGPVVVMVVEAPEAIKQVRRIVGATNPQDADVGTIRQTWAQDVSRNIIHASDKPESAEREIGIFFNKNEILDYPLAAHKLMFTD
jgi:nucleoside-diphosphate kinase